MGFSTIIDNVNIVLLCACSCNSMFQFSLEPPNQLKLETLAFVIFFQNKFSRFIGKPIWPLLRLSIFSIFSSWCKLHFHSIFLSFYLYLPLATKIWKKRRINPRKFVRCEMQCANSLQTSLFWPMCLILTIMWF